MSGSPAAVVVYITCTSFAQAEALARHLIDERLAACANIIPGMRSLYRWQGVIESAEETVLILKTAAACVPALTARVKQLHTFTVPCVVAVPVVDGSAEYLAWIAAETVGEGPEVRRSGSPEVRTP
ncbi:MAG: divalent-cation tolerance protein CutA [Planctomycetes bacterium]|nr:divalent-cation tolerance protein CutA [Planctomycetota bacterium]